VQNYIWLPSILCRRTIAGRVDNYRLKKSNPLSLLNVGMNRHIDIGSFVVALITLGMFVAALFTKGLTHDLFLESGVFLVSVKIIVMAYKNSESDWSFER
jgi:hypothetical protein